MKDKKGLKIYKLEDNTTNAINEIILLAKNEEEARLNASTYAYHFLAASNIKCYEIGVASKEALTNGCLISPWMHIVSIHIDAITTSKV